VKKLVNIIDATKELNILRSKRDYKAPFEVTGTYRLIDDGLRPEATVIIKAKKSEMHEAHRGGPCRCPGKCLEKILVIHLSRDPGNKACRFFLEDPRFTIGHVGKR